MKQNWVLTTKQMRDRVILNLLFSLVYPFILTPAFNTLKDSFMVFNKLFQSWNVQEYNFFFFLFSLIPTVFTAISGISIIVSLNQQKQWSSWLLGGLLYIFYFCGYYFFAFFATFFFIWDLADWSIN